MGTKEGAPNDLDDRLVSQELEGPKRFAFKRAPQRREKEANDLLSFRILCLLVGFPGNLDLAQFEQVEAQRFEIEIEAELVDGHENVFTS